MATRVLIADDEVLAREGLATLVASLDGFEVVAVARDGEEAVAMARETHPRICILDVRMPKRNGLETLALIRHEAPGVRCIIYSGHDEFRYAQAAVRLHADEYLLKPASQEVLTRALLQVRRDILPADGGAGLHVKTEWQLEQGFDAVEEVFFRNLLEDNVSLDDMAEYQDVLGVHGGCARVSIVSIDDGPEIPTVEGESRRSDLRASLAASARRVCDRAIAGRVPIVLKGGEVVLVVCEHLLKEGFSRYLRHEVRLDVGYDVTVAVGDLTPLEELARSYATAQRRLGYRLVLGGRRVIGPDDDAGIAPSGVAMPTEDLVGMKRNVLYGDRVAVQEAVTRLIRHLQKNAAGPESWRHFCFQIYEECLFQVREQVPDLDAHVTPIQLSRSLQDVSTAVELDRWLRSSLGQLMDAMEATCRSYSLPLKKAFDYIDRHYTTDFTLRDLATYVQLNPSYLSSLISRESGRTFVEHVTERRIAKAKELLLTGRFNISEVAYQLGYATPRYFSMVFRKRTGTTPSSFQHGVVCQVGSKES